MFDSHGEVPLIHRHTLTGVVFTPTVKAMMTFSVSAAVKNVATCVPDGGVPADPYSLRSACGHDAATLANETLELQVLS
jgi:hypothetical protein